MENVTPHVLRHTFATMDLQKGISLAAVQKSHGHERLGTTAIYLDLTDLHVVEKYAQKGRGDPGLNLFAGICKKPQSGLWLRK